MRHVERQKNLDRLGKRQYTTVLFCAHLSDVNHDDQELKFGPGLTVLCGGNGAGKSTTLGALWRCLNGTDRELLSIPQVPYWLANVEISGTHGGTDWTASYDTQKGIFDGKRPAPVLYIDPSSETSTIIAQLLGVK